MIIQKKVKITINSRNVSYYRKLKYKVNVYDDIEVDVSDVQKGSHIKLLCCCDNCDKEIIKSYKDYLKIVNEKGKYLCRSCAEIYRKETNNEKYGCDNCSQDPIIKKKISDKMKKPTN